MRRVHIARRARETRGAAAKQERFTRATWPDLTHEGAQLSENRGKRSGVELNEIAWTPATEEEITAVLAESGVSSLDEVPEGGLEFHGWRELFDYLMEELPDGSLTPAVRRALRLLEVKDEDPPG